MNMRHEHLNDEQIAASVVEDDPELTAHLHDCAECSAKAERLQQSLAGFGSFVRENAERTNSFWWRQRAAASAPAIHLARWATAAAALLITFGASYSLIHNAVEHRKGFAVQQVQPQVAPARQISDEALLSEVQNDVRREYPDAFAPVQANAESEVAVQLNAQSSQKEAYKKEHKRK